MSTSSVHFYVPYWAMLYDFHACGIEGFKGWDMGIVGVGFAVHAVKQLRLANLYM